MRSVCKDLGWPTTEYHRISEVRERTETAKRGDIPRSQYEEEYNVFKIYGRSLHEYDTLTAEAIILMDSIRNLHADHKEKAKKGKGVI